MLLFFFLKGDFVENWLQIYCDARWSKSIRIFAANFFNITSVLEKLSHNNDSDFKVNTTTRTKEH